MTPVQSTEKAVEVAASNIGGIDETTVELAPGVNILTGRNATNRTSFLQAIMAALGSDEVSLKGNAEEGRVTLSLGDETCTRTLARRNGTVTTSGDPYLDDPELADLFAFLLESNEARQAVARSGDLRELIMRPVDTDAIEAEIDQLKGEQRQVEQQLDEIESLKDRLPTRESQRTKLEETREETREALKAKKAELEEADADVDRTRNGKAELERKLSELNRARSDLEDVRFRLETTQESLESLREERADLKEDLDDLPVRPTGEISEVNDRIERLRGEKRQLDSLVSKLQNLIQFNQDMLEGDDDLLRVLGHLHDGHDHANDDKGESVTDRLLADSTSVCWTCGTEVERERIAETLDELRDIARKKRSDRASLTDKLDELKAERRRLEETQERRDQLDRRQSRLGAEIEEREGTIESLKDEREELEAEIERLEDEAAELESEDYSDVLEKHKEVNQLEFELDRTESEIEDLDAEIEDLHERVDEKESLETQREEIQAELRDLRTRIEQLEEDAVSAFNEHMDRILDLLSYGNLDRIWIERTEQQVREGRRKVSQTAFTLHVVRSTDNGASYEDTVDHLSESEREVTGLVFALAGYLVHDVHEMVPFMLLDSLEAIDSERIATLVDYFKEYADHLVVALLPEDAQALDSDYDRVTEI